MHDPTHGRPAAERLLTPSTWALLLGAWAVVGLFFAFGGGWLAAPIDPAVAAGVFAGLFVTILAASFGVVREADHLAHQLGEPYGTLVLTLSIVSIEVILIASVLLGPGSFPTIGRDSIFAVMMVILNLVVGVCLVAGAARNGGQEYNAQGAVGYLSMVVLLTGTSLVLPSFLSGAGEFSASQAIAVGVLTALLYAVFLWQQMGGHRRLFIQPAAGAMAIPDRGARGTAGEGEPTSVRHVDRWAVLVRSTVLLFLILPIVLLAHHLAVVTDYGIAAVGAPAAVGGVLIAVIVFTPESIAAVRAAVHNEMQRAINLCLGAFVSTVGLTVPAVLAIGLLTGEQVVMGISPMEMVLFALTVALGMLTFNGQRTSALQGCMHIALFLVFGVLLFQP